MWAVVAANKQTLQINMENSGILKLKKDLIVYSSELSVYAYSKFFVSNTISTYKRVNMYCIFAKPPN
ncbi:unnamed protein product [Ceratitis capitata]|uniref:(Mediterranean fruit fly) hypothetical protein n=1 Tax=Ceratitis capitata TaxID=7213 RepID=A0A811V1H2_CERCA|nr:unnamed protein product [Ceratitis capitata]